jgi:hypothetical protein
MATRVDIRRPAGGIVKVDFNHLGTDSIQASLNKTLLGSTGEDQTHVLEIRELAADISQHFCLSTVNAQNESQYLFRIMGRYSQGYPLRDENGDVVYLDFYLGDRPFLGIAGLPDTKINLGGLLPGTTNDFYSVFSPSSYSLNDALWNINQKVTRISNTINTLGWTDVIDAANHNGYSDGGPPIGTVGGAPGIPVLQQPAIDYEDDEKAPEPVISLQVTPGGYLGIRGTAEFWNAFFVQCSPYFQYLTGFPEILCRTGDVSGEAGSLQVGGAAGQWVVNANNARAFTFLSSAGNHPKTIFSTFEERREIIISSMLPTPFERHVSNNEESHRFTLGYWHIRGFHETSSGRTMKSNALTDEWTLIGTTVVGKTLMDKPSQTGFNTLVLPSSIPSLQIRAFLRRKRWNFETDTMETVEIPLMQNPEDLLTLRLILTLQQ